MSFLVYGVIFFKFQIITRRSLLKSERSFVVTRSTSNFLVLTPVSQKISPKTELLLFFGVGLPISAFAASGREEAVGSEAHCYVSLRVLRISAKDSLCSSIQRCSYRNPFCNLRLNSFVALMEYDKNSRVGQEKGGARPCCQRPESLGEACEMNHRA